MAAETSTTAPEASVTRPGVIRACLTLRNFPARLKPRCEVAGLDGGRSRQESQHWRFPDIYVSSNGYVVTRNAAPRANVVTTIAWLVRFTPKATSILTQRLTHCLTTSRPHHPLKPFQGRHEERLQHENLLSLPFNVAGKVPEPRSK